MCSLLRKGIRASTGNHRDGLFLLPLAVSFIEYHIDSSLLLHTTGKEQIKPMATTPLSCVSCVYRSYLPANARLRGYALLRSWPPHCLNRFSTRLCPRRECGCAQLGHWDGTRGLFCDKFSCCTVIKDPQELTETDRQHNHF